MGLTVCVLQWLQVLAAGDEYVSEYSLSFISYLFHRAEVVLAVLLPRFAFEVTDKPVAWNSSAVMYPTMGEESTKPELVLKVKTISA